MDAVQKANAGHPGTAMALAPRCLPALRGGDAARSSGARLAGPRPLHPLRRPRLHPPVRLAPSLGLRPDARRPEAVPTVGLADARASRARPHAGHRDDDGPLGQGFANGVGLAIAQRFLAERWNRPRHAIVDSWVYAICSDGDLMEGVSQEAASIAGQLGLGRLVYVYDDNHITIDGTTAISFVTEDKGKRFEAYGWHVQHVDDPNDLDALRGRVRRGARRRGAALADRAALATSPTRRRTRSTRRRRTARRSVRPRCAARRRSSASTPTRRSSSRTPCASTWPASASAAPQRARRGRTASPPGRRRIPTPPPSGQRDLERPSARRLARRAAHVRRRESRSRPATRARR